MGIRGITNSRFESYLSNRTQETVTNDCIDSEKEYTSYGVPQGCVLGPLLFLLYINDITKASTKFNFFLVADDTKFTICENEELTKVSDWLIANKLTSNIIKIKLFYFSTISEKGNLKIANQIF